MKYLYTITQYSVDAFNPTQLAGTPKINLELYDDNISDEFIAGTIANRVTAYENWIKSGEGYGYKVAAAIFDNETGLFTSVGTSQQRFLAPREKKILNTEKQAEKKFTVKTKTRMAFDVEAYLVHSSAAALGNNIPPSPVTLAGAAPAGSFFGWTESHPMDTLNADVPPQF